MKNRKKSTGILTPTCVKFFREFPSVITNRYLPAYRALRSVWYRQQNKNLIPPPSLPLQCHTFAQLYHTMTTSIRLAKRLIELSACSRREAELYIAGGWVTVDGLVVEEPQFMVSQQHVELHPEATLTPIEPATMVFHLPAAVLGSEQVTALLSAESRTADDPSGIHLLKQHFFRLTECTPIEPGAFGLQVYTQDWRVTRKLKDDANTMEQEYVAEVAGTLTAEGLKLLKHGLMFNGILLKPIKVSWQNEHHLRFAVKGIIPGQIKHACATVGLQVLSLRRLRIGRVAMSRLPSGQWRYLMPHERF